jgi:HSP20 family protein
VPGRAARNTATRLELERRVAASAGRSGACSVMDEPEGRKAMANVVKKDGGQQAQGAPQGQQPSQPERGELLRRDPFLLARDPFQAFMRDPFQLMRELMADPYRMFQMSPFSGRDMGWNPGFEVRETDDAFLFKADMPGIRSEDLEISLTGNQLSISGKREHEQEQGEGRFHTYERSYGSFERSFSLPESADMDKIRSDLKDGVLTLVVPKKPGTSPQRRKIAIGSGTKS